MTTSDEFARFRAEMDQGREGLKEVSSTLGSFFTALVADGFTREEALAIVLAWLTSQMGGSE